MQIYKNLSEDKKFAVKTVLIIATLLLVVNILTKYLSDNGSLPTLARDGYGVDIAQYGEAKSVESMYHDPIMPPVGLPVPGVDAEAYEVRSYFVSVETGDKGRDCTTLMALKRRDDVIFESVSESTYGCSVSFKVKQESVDMILDYLDELDPREVNEHTYTIKREVSQYEDQMAILEAKQVALDTALQDALQNFAEVEVAARRSGDVASLAQITESKIMTIERINASRLDVVTELDRLSRAKAEVLDQMNFAQFSVNVYEKEWVRGEDLKDSWFAAMQQLVRDLNEFLQDLSIGFVQFLLTVITYTLYASALYLIVRPIINRARHLWQSK